MARTFDHAGITNTAVPRPCVLCKVGYDAADSTEGDPLKVATFNINNINKRLDNLVAWLAKAEPDVVSLQELKAEQEGGWPTPSSHTKAGALPFSRSLQEGGAFETRGREVSFDPGRGWSASRFLPRLAPWTAFLRRFAAWG